MNIKLFSSVLIIGACVISCNKAGTSIESGTVADSSAATEVEDNADTTITMESVDVEPPAIDESTADIALLQQFYEKCVFGSASPKKYCTSKCLKRLAAANEYDAGGYAVWEFRTDNQDGSGASMVTDVQPDDDGWYTVSYKDMGHKGITKVLVEDGKIADYKRIK